MHLLVLWAAFMIEWQRGLVAAETMLFTELNIHLALYTKVSADLYESAVANGPIRNPPKQYLIADPENMSNSWHTYYV